MRITFIGTAPGYPEPNRKCTCILIEIRDKKYILDMGCNPVEYLTNVGIHVREIDTVFISHVHGDHLNGIIPFTELVNWKYPDAKVEFYVPTLKVRDAINSWKALNHAALREDRMFYEIKEGMFYQDGILSVTAFANMHMEKSYTFLFEAEGKRVLFTGDLGKDGGRLEFPGFVRGEYDLIACEGAHFSPLDYQETLRRNPPKEVYIYHYGPRYLKDILTLGENMKEVVPVKLATDGLIVNL